MLSEVRRDFLKISSYFRVICKNDFSTSKIKMNKPGSKYNLDYLLVLDFEATCDDRKQYVQEIIEFPVLKINRKTLEEEARFHKYVRPTVNPILTPFCTDLTGIIQEMVEKEKTFPEVLDEFEKWREKENLTEYNSLYVTSGEWDLGAMMPDQCGLCNIPVPKHMMQWNNIKKTFAYLTKRYPRSLLDMIKYLGLEFQGRAHSGIVDSENIYAIVKKLIKEHNVNFLPTSQLVDTPHGLKKRAQPGVKINVEENNTSADEET